MKPSRHEATKWSQRHQGTKCVHHFRTRSLNPWSPLPAFVPPCLSSPCPQRSRNVPSYRITSIGHAPPRTTAPRRAPGFTIPHKICETNPPPLAIFGALGVLAVRLPSPSAERSQVPFCPTRQSAPIRAKPFQTIPKRPITAPAQNKATCHFGSHAVPLFMFHVFMFHARRRPTVPNGCGTTVPGVSSDSRTQEVLPVTKAV